MDRPLPLNTRSTPAGDRDYFPTPPWATRALCEALSGRGLLFGSTVWEPACGEGYMSRPLGEYFREVRSTDIEDCRDAFPDQDGVVDFLLDWPDPSAPPASDWIVTNPPFNRAEEFFELAYRRARVGVAFFVKQQFLEGIGRYRSIFSRHWPRLILQFAERVPLVKGRVDPEAGTNQAYIWIVWIKRDRFGALDLDPHAAPEFGWIGPCRKRLERPDDYPAPAPPAPSAPTELLALMGEAPAAAAASHEESNP
ncbi:hypothetical protein [Rhodovulum marinum]|uniref:Methyltransferase family protein n=1 Tax=Rhodovulum marinum TaxID=320662 RepID=A0A4R2Q555_9RHOB|nr:hypothetical protein [Rhodovulum marinum]TCP43953.1 hypothetical protein EV662_10137 [Rhodovulum marinum]